MSRIQRRTLIGIPPTDHPGALPAEEIDDASVIVEDDVDHFDVDIYKAMVRAEDDARFRRLCADLMTEMIRERRSRMLAAAAKHRRRRRVGDIATGLIVAAFTAMATVAVAIPILKWLSSR